MNRKLLRSVLNPLWILTLLLAACNLPGNGQPSAVPVTTAPAVVTASDTPLPAGPTGAVASDTPAGPAVTDTPALPPPTDTQVPLPPTEVIPTPTLGPALAHLSAGQKIDIATIDMLDASQGWGIGGLSQASDHVFRTKDGGKTWQDVTPPQPAPASGSTLQASGAFRDAATAWVVYSLAGSGPADAFTLIWSTRDGGATWSYFSLDTTSIGAEFFIPSNMTFVDAQHGWFLAHVGAGMMHDYVAILATGDGGVSWQALLDPNSDGGIQSCGKNAMAFADTQTGWLTPDCDGVDPVPHLFKTGDGGSTWQRIDLQAPSGAPAGFLDNNACGMHDPVLFSAASAVFAMKCKDTATFTVEKDYLYSTSDGGQTWQTTALPSDFTVLAEPAGGLFFPSAGAGLALSRKIYATADGGKTWSLAKLVNWDGQFDFLDLKTGWAVARNSGQIALVATTDGGGTWQQLKPTVAP